MMSSEVKFRIATELDASEAVLKSSGFAARLGLDEAASQMVATAVSELARNILKYAEQGQIALRAASRGAHRGIEIESTDRGPGIADPESAMRDHYSSGGTLGLGLPGVKRMMDEFQLDSTPGEGTRILARKWV